MDVVAVLACPYRKENNSKCLKSAVFWRGQGGVGSESDWKSTELGSSYPFFRQINGRHKIHDTAINIREFKHTIAPRNHFTPFGPLGPSNPPPRPHPPAGCQKKELQPSKGFSKSPLKTPRCFRFSRRIGRKGGEIQRRPAEISQPPPPAPSFLKLLLFFTLNFALFQLLGFYCQNDENQPRTEAAESNAPPLLLPPPPPPPPLRQQPLLRLFEGKVSTFFCLEDFFSLLLSDKIQMILKHQRYCFIQQFALTR